MAYSPYPTRAGRTTNNIITRKQPLGLAHPPDPLISEYITVPTSLTFTLVHLLTVLTDPHVTPSIYHLASLREACLPRGKLPCGAPT
jgi:hypothetical protein